MNVLCGHQVPFSGIWPTSAMTVSGRLYPLPVPEPPTAASDGSASPGLLPAPMAADGGGEVIKTGLLKTPTAQLAVNGGSQHPDKRRAGGHGPTLADQVEHLLPTPRTGDNRNSRVALTGANSSRHGRTAKGSASGLGLEQAIELAQGKTPRELLLPTPNATDSQGGTRAVPERRTSSGKDHGPRLRDVAPALLPTPIAGDAKSARNTTATGSRAKAHPGTTLTDALLPTPTARLGDDTSRGADPARYKGPQSLNGRRSNLDDCIAAVETQAPWLSPGEPTSQPSADGNAPPDGWHQAQLSLDGLDPG
jgi:hypothetical protein